MKKTITKIFALLAAICGLQVFGVTPIAMWDGDFSCLTNGAFIITDSGTSTDPSYLTVGSSSIKITADPEAGAYNSAIFSSQACTIIVDYSDYTYSSGVPLLTSTMHQSDGNYEVGVASYAANAVKGVWRQPSSCGIQRNGDSSSSNVALTGSETKRLTLAYAKTYSGGNGTEIFLDGTSIFKEAGLLGGSLIPYGFAIGGLYTAFNNIGVASNVQVHRIAVFSSRLSTSEIAAFKFPSEVDTQLTATLSGTAKNWSDAMWNNGTSDSQSWTDGANATVTVTANTTLTIGTAATATNVIFNVSSGKTLTLTATAALTSGLGFTVKGGGTVKIDSTKFDNLATGNIFVAEDSTFEISSSGNDINAKTLSRLTGYGTVKFSSTGSYYYLLNSTSSNLPAKSLTWSIEETSGIIIPDITTTLDVGSLTGSTGFRSDYGQGTSRSLRAIQYRDTTWSGTFTCGSTTDRLATFYVAGATGVSSKTLTLSADCTSVSNDLNVASSGSLKLTGKWKGNTTVNGSFGGTGSLTGDFTIADTGIIDNTFGVPTISGTLTFPTTTKVRMTSAPAAGSTVKVLAKAGTTAADIGAAEVYVGNSTASDGNVYRLAYQTDGVYLYRVVAMIGETPYATLTAAFDKATSGTTVTLLAAPTETSTITIPTGVILDPSNSSYMTGRTISGAGTIVTTEITNPICTLAQGDDGWKGVYKITGSGTTPEAWDIAKLYNGTNSTLWLDVTLSGTATGNKSYLKGGAVNLGALKITGTLTVNNGFSHDSSGYEGQYTFRTLAGDGTLSIVAPGGKPYTHYAFKDAKDFTGTITMSSTGRERVILGGEAQEASAVDSAICICTNAVATIATGKTWTAASKIVVYGTLNLTGTTSGTVTGDGTVVITSKSTTVPAGITTAGGWSGTVWLKDITDVNGQNFTNYGNTGSIVRLTNVKGWLASGSTANTILELKDDEDTVAFTMTVGNSKSYYFNTLIGDGTLKMQQSGEGTTVYIVKDASGFTGAAQVVSPSNQGNIDLVFSSSATGCSESMHTNLVIDADMTIHKAWSSDGRIIINQGKTVTLEDNGSLSATAGVILNGSLVMPATATAPAMTTTLGDSYKVCISATNETSVTYTAAAPIASIGTGDAAVYYSTWNAAIAVQKSFGGTITIVDTSAELPEGYVNDGSNVLVLKSAQVATVVIDNVTHYYASFSAAFEAAHNAGVDTVTMYRDVDLGDDDYVEITYNDIALDLGHHTLSGSFGYGGVIVAYGGTLTGLTIKSGTIKNTGAGSAVYTYASDFDLKLSDVHLESKGGEAIYAFGITITADGTNNSITTEQTATSEINIGAINAAYKVTIGGTGTLAIKGVTFGIYTQMSIDSYLPSVVVTNSNTTIKADYAIDAVGAISSDETVTNAPQVTITGGTFNGYVEAKAVVSGTTTDKRSSKWGTITGGTFNSNAYNYYAKAYIAAGYAFNSTTVDNVTTYTVVRKTFQNPVTGKDQTFVHQFLGTTDANWANVANWKYISGNTLIAEVQTDGTTAATNAPGVSKTDAKDPWAATLFDGDFLAIKNVTAPGNSSYTMEGYNPKYGLFNGAKVTVNSIEKLQAPGGGWIMVDKDSKLIIENNTNNKVEGTINLYIASEEGFDYQDTDTSNGDGTFNYYLIGDGTVNFECSVKSKQCMQQAQFDVNTTSAYTGIGKKMLVSYGGMTGTVSVDTATASCTTSGVTAKPVSALTYSEGIGAYKFGYDSTGIFIEYIEKTDTAVAKIGETGYGTFQEALDKATTGQTITLCGAASSSATTMTIPAGVTVTTTSNSYLDNIKFDGQGTVELAAWPSDSTTRVADGWTGTVVFPSATGIEKPAFSTQINYWGNENSSVKLQGVGKATKTSNEESTYIDNTGKKITPAIELAAGTTLYINNGWNNTTTTTTKLTGAGNLTVTFAPADCFTVAITTLNEFTGTLTATSAKTTIKVGTVNLSAGTTVAAGMKILSTSGSVSVDKLAVNGVEQTGLTFVYMSDGVYVARAKIGTTGYLTLTDAMNAAADGATIVALADGSTTLKSTGTISIDSNGHNVTVNRTTLGTTISESTSGTVTTYTSMRKTFDTAIVYDSATTYVPTTLTDSGLDVRIAEIADLAILGTMNGSNVGEDCSAVGYNRKYAYDEVGNPTNMTVQMQIFHKTSTGNFLKMVRITFAEVNDKLMILATDPWFIKNGSLGTDFDSATHDGVGNTVATADNNGTYGIKGLTIMPPVSFPEGYNKEVVGNVGTVTWICPRDCATNVNGIAIGTKPLAAYDGAQTSSHVAITIVADIPTTKPSGYLMSIRAIASSATNNRTFSVYSNGTNLKFNYTDGDGDHDRDGSCAVVTGVHTFTFYYDLATLYLYIDGSLAMSNACKFDSRTMSGDVAIGGKAETRNNAMNGLVVKSIKIDYSTATTADTAASEASAIVSSSYTFPTQLTDGCTTAEKMAIVQTFPPTDGKTVNAPVYTVGGKLLTTASKMKTIYDANSSATSLTIPAMKIGESGTAIADTDKLIDLHLLTGITGDTEQTVNVPTFTTPAQNSAVDKITIAANLSTPFAGSQGWLSLKSAVPGGKYRRYATAKTGSAASHNFEVTLSNLLTNDVKGSHFKLAGEVFSTAPSCVTNTGATILSGFDRELLGNYPVADGAKNWSGVVADRITYDKTTSSGSTYRIPAIAKGNGMITTLYDARSCFVDLGQGDVMIDFAGNDSTDNGNTWTKPALKIDVPNYACDYNTYKASHPERGYYDIIDPGLGYDARVNKFIAMGSTGKGLFQDANTKAGSMISDVKVFTREASADKNWCINDKAVSVTNTIFTLVTNAMNMTNKSTANIRGFLQNPGHMLTLDHSITNEDKSVIIEEGTPIISMQFFQDKTHCQLLAAWYDDINRLEEISNWHVTKLTDGTQSEHEGSLTILDDDSLYMISKGSNATTRAAWRSTDYKNWVQCDPMSKFGGVEGSILRIGTKSGVGIYSATMPTKDTATNRGVIKLFIGTDNTSSDNVAKEPITWNTANPAATIWSDDSTWCQGYTSQVLLDQHTLGVLFEAQSHIYFQAVDISEYVD